jgi:hypothetical protein
MPPMKHGRRLPIAAREGQGPMRSRRVVTLLAFAAFLTLCTGLAHAIHLSDSGPAHRADDCGVCVDLLAGKAVALDPVTSIPIAEHADWLSVSLPADCPAIVHDHEPVAPRAPPEPLLHA